MLKTGIIWISGLAIALVSGLTAMGAIAKNKAPELAIALPPTNGYAAENIASKSVQIAIAENAGQFPDQIDPKVSELARQAFIAEPVTPEAVAVLALSGADQSKRELMGKALSLTRRQPLITAWMIADSGAQKDIPALLNHYDSMLRTNSSAASAIIPVMAEALADESFIAPYTSLLEKQPPWASQFWGAVVRTPVSVVNAALLREALYKPDENDDIYRDAGLIRTLAFNQHFETAEALYHLLAGQKETSSFVKNGSFDAEPEFYPIDWQLFSTGEYGAAVTGGKLQLSAIQNSGGLFARQLVKLPAKIVKLDIKPRDPIPDNARIIVSLRCAQAMDNAPRTIRIPLEREITDLQINNANSGCSFYWMEISGRASENGGGFDIALDSISLR
ncbi:hypothetical protein [Parasphingorhabdus sp.]|uniref:hypothetical protein n=1 Tax=Parasphingorhabdus sp. TaxID=2709688 RepID=UPI002F95A975